MCSYGVISASIRDVFHIYYTVDWQNAGKKGLMEEACDCPARNKWGQDGRSQWQQAFLILLLFQAATHAFA